MTNITRYTGLNSNRLLSPNLWQHINYQRIISGLNDGVFFFDDFHTSGSAISTNKFSWYGGSPTKLWEGFGTIGVTAGAVTNSADGATIGELKFSVDADDEEAYMMLDNDYSSPLGKITDTAGSNKPLLFEARVKFSDVAAGAAACGKFIGLGQTAFAVTGALGADAASMAAQEFVGFRAIAADGDGMDATHYDAAEVVVLEAASDTSLNVVADTYKKFGIYFDGTKTYWFVNGVQVGSGVLPAATNFPDGELLVPVFGIRQHGAGTMTASIDWVAFAQEG